jgi:hypothetical protein
MLSYHYKPGPPLDRFVHVIWCFEQAPMPHAKERLLPDGSVEMVINLHEERIPVYSRENLDRSEIFRGGVVCGPHSHFFAIDTVSELNVVGVHFKPGGAYPFFRLPCHELYNLHVGLDTLWGHRAGEVRERLLASATPAARARVLEQALLDASDGTLERHPAVAFALNEFHAAPEARKIGAVGDAAGLSAAIYRSVSQGSGIDAEIILPGAAVPESTTDDFGWTGGGLGGYCGDVRILRSSSLHSRLPGVFRNKSIALSGGPR